MTKEQLELANKISKKIDKNTIQIFDIDRCLSLLESQENLFSKIDIQAIFENGNLQRIGTVREIETGLIFEILNQTKERNKEEIKELELQLKNL